MDSLIEVVLEDWWEGIADDKTFAFDVDDLDDSGTEDVPLWRAACGTVCTACDVFSVLGTVTEAVLLLTDLSFAPIARVLFVATVL